MFVLGNLIDALALIVKIVLNIYMWVIIFRAVISWVNPDPYNQIVIILHRITEPVLGPIRRKIPMHNIGIDISPIIVILIILFLQYFVVETLRQFALNLKMS